MVLSPDPHGQAALMLCESLMLLLIESGVISKDRAIEAVSNVMDVKQEIGENKESVVVSVTSILLLQEVERSLIASQVLNRSATG